MRKVMAAALLAATVLAPMAANAQDGGHRGDGQGRQGGGQHQGGRAQGQGQPRSQTAPQAQAQSQPQAQSRPGGPGDGGSNRFEGGGQGQRGGYAGQPGQLQGRPGGYQGANPYQGQRGGQPGQPGNFRGWPGSNGGRQFAQPGQQVLQGQQGRPGDDRGRRDDGGYRGGQGYAGRGAYGGAGYRGYQGGGYGNPGYNADRRDFARDGARFAGRSDWNRGWRSDGRYNYGSYRQSHYNLFRLPRYEAPYGYDYGYRRFGIGAVLNDIFFAEDYWIDDPYEYRLPPAYDPYRWVRYYGDALLVDVDTGEVVDTVYGIFD